MTVRFSWRQWVTVGLLAAMVMGAFVFFPQTSFAQTDDTDDQTTTPAAPWGRGGMMFGERGAMGDLRGQHDAFLAEALGITVEELQAAQQKAHEAMMAQAVEDGAITQEQADLMAARHAFMQFYKENATLTVEEALSAAVEAGAITQEQADLLQSTQGQYGHGMYGRGMDGRGMDGFRSGGRGFHQHDMMPGRGNRMRPGYQAPAPTPEANS